MIYCTTASVQVCTNGRVKEHFWKLSVSANGNRSRGRRRVRLQTFLAKYPGPSPGEGQIRGEALTKERRPDIAWRRNIARDREIRLHGERNGMGEA
jgi:hypothetical protein